MDEELLKGVKEEIRKASPRVSAAADGAAGRFGEWKVQQLLGRNSIGELYLVHREGLDGPQQFALRSFDSSLSRNPRLVKRFLQEAEKAAPVKHPNIAPVLDFGRTEDGSAYLVREFVPGQTLYSVLQSGPIEYSRSIEIALAICRALAEAEKSELLHRDLNPANVIIKTDGDVCVVDFGLSKSVPAEGRETRGLTHYNESRADLRYISPEQIKDERLDPRSDVYSLGCIMHAMFSGEELHSDLAGFRLLQAKLKKPIDKNVFDNLKLTGAGDRHKAIERVALIVQRAVSGDRELRYATAEELHDDLRRLADGKDLQPATLKANKAIASARGEVEGEGKKRVVGGFWAGLIGASVTLVSVVVALSFAPNDRSQSKTSNAVSAAPAAMTTVAPAPGKQQQNNITSEQLVKELPGTWTCRTSINDTWSLQIDTCYATKNDDVVFAGFVKTNHGITPVAGQVFRGSRFFQFDGMDANGEAKYFQSPAGFASVVMRGPGGQLLIQNHNRFFTAWKTADAKSEWLRQYSIKKEVIDGLAGWWAIDSAFWPLPKKIFLKPLGDKGIFELHGVDPANNKEWNRELIGYATIDKNNRINNGLRRDDVYLQYSQSQPSLSINGKVAGRKLD